MVINGFLMPLMNAAVAAVIACFIVAGLIAIDPVVALASGVGFTGIYLLASFAIRSRLRLNSRIIECQIRSTGRRSGGVEVEIAGRVTALLGEEAYPNGVGGVWGRMVAEEGFEPPTHGL